MCGIVGYCGYKPVNISKLKTLLLFNEHRGGDSCGVAVKGTVLKKVGGSVDFVSDESFEKTVGDSKLVIAHNRKKSVGTVSVDNAHPFKKGDIVGIHNGTLYNHAAIATKYNIKWTVDSEVIFELLSKYKNDPTVLSELTGAAAIAWFDETEKYSRIYLLRNKDRPLFIGEDKEFQGCYYFSSLEESLHAIDCKGVVGAKENDVNYIGYADSRNRWGWWKHQEGVRILPSAATSASEHTTRVTTYNNSPYNQDAWDDDIRFGRRGYATTQKTVETSSMSESEISSLLLSKAKTAALVTLLAEMKRGGVTPSEALLETVSKLTFDVYSKVV